MIVDKLKLSSSTGSSPSSAEDDVDITTTTQTTTSTSSPVTNPQQNSLKRTHDEADLDKEYFTSDGEKLLCFSKDLKEIQLYRFLGSSPKYPKSTTKTQKEAIDKNFNTYFRLIYQTVIPPFNEFLCKDFSLTTACGKYFILSSYGQSINSNNNNNINRAEMDTFIRQSQSNSINLPNPEDITFYLVRISDGVVCDKRTFKKDVIHLAHHSGVYLYQDFFIVLSLQYQTIHIFQIKGSKFVNIRSIGPHCNEDDQLEIDSLENAEKSFIPMVHEKQQKAEQLASIQPFLKTSDINSKSTTSTVSSTSSSSTTTTNTTNNVTFSVTNNNNNNANNINNNIPNNTNNINNNQPQTTTTTTTTNNQSSQTNNTDSLSYNHSLPSGNLMGIKQRFLSYLYKKAATSPDPKKSLSLYFSLFPQYCNLVMWKMQSLDASHLLIKFGPIDGLLGRLADYCNQISFFVVYNMHTTEVIGVYENSNKEFAKTFEQFCEHFRACSCPSGLIKFRSTCSNNIFVREHLMKQKLAVVNARYGGETQAVKRILSALPFSPQSWNESPYFDKYLFSYDEKMISSTERPKPLVDYPIKFYSRFGGEVKFKMNNGIQDKNDRQSKKYATYIFHPYCPFIISLQHSSATNTFVANFHFKSDDLEVEKDFLSDSSTDQQYEDENDS
ncbi:hypothetical protein PPL_02051 [Heterostelium album PN500]|uniref:Uncharacterized protein n=1 Tax=Heterostelium pallidum (strain ATCC 26659 / Pp 5 / PN500) TaxID=670386 RepID=D3B181_HETP5|nr:hypothetical protein PPL_02051 [Heterostelium album PN500]EFA85055.1 hypothetical protein PPL_02051 [Heterostelium album PN500]|eukprot:XP_020437165.1 hypothetical protein PPL_02051 [Heterostelium album PN500]